ncbi:hypothetical protein [Paracoccus thiocyanatus]|uniref:hypothetical protein n=1 Tax=Paracoccus thiocyanatus TaxID=34006 RepID=UPI001C6EA273|nr:hypothetical protein [Paracoccus thiocyanatus]
MPSHPVDRLAAHGDGRFLQIEQIFGDGRLSVPLLAGAAATWRPKQVFFPAPKKVSFVIRRRCWHFQASNPWRKDRMDNMQDRAGYRDAVQTRIAELGPQVVPAPGSAQRAAAAFDMREH